MLSFHLSDVDAILNCGSSDWNDLNHLFAGAIYTIYTDFIIQDIDQIWTILNYFLMYRIQVVYSVNEMNWTCLHPIIEFVNNSESKQNFILNNNWKSIKFNLTSRWRWSPFGGYLKNVFYFIKKKTCISDVCFFLSSIYKTPALVQEMAWHLNQWRYKSLTPEDVTMIKCATVCIVAIHLQYICLCVQELLCSNYLKDIHA